jgi:hypothetical protein
MKKLEAEREKKMRLETQRRKSEERKAREREAWDRIEQNKKQMGIRMNLSHNMRGLKIKAKLIATRNLIMEYGIGNYFGQETHIPGTPEGEKQKQAFIQHMEGGTKEDPIPLAMHRYLYFWGNGEPARNGVVSMVRKDELTHVDVSHIELTDNIFSQSHVNREIMKEGRILVLHFNNGKEPSATHTQIGIYAPSEPKERPAWYKELTKVVRAIRKEVCENIVIVGDFNFVMDLSMDRIGGAAKKSNGKEHQIQEELLEKCNLIDLWRQHNPTEIGTSWTNGAASTRIDRVHACPNIAFRTAHVEHITWQKNDHSALLWATYDESKTKTKPKQKVDPDVYKTSDFHSALKEIVDRITAGGNLSRMDTPTMYNKYEKLKQDIKEMALEATKKRKTKYNKDLKKASRHLKKCGDTINWLNTAVLKGYNYARRNKGKRMISELINMKILNRDAAILSNDSLRRTLIALEEKRAYLLTEKEEIYGKRRKQEEEQMEEQETDGGSTPSKYFFANYKAPRNNKKLDIATLTSYRVSTELANGDILVSTQYGKRPDCSDAATTLVERSETEKEGMHEITRDFYQLLMTSEQPTEEAKKKRHDDDLKNMCRAVNFETTEADRTRMNRPITHEELRKTIMSIPAKAPGVDGLNITFYKENFKAMSPWLLAIFNKIIECGEMPESMKQALLVLIFKNKGDRHDISKYRPISLLCLDYKIFTKLWATRANEIIKRVIGPEQGAIRDTHRCLLQVQGWMDHAKTEKLDLALTMMDYEKAFDRVEWDAIHAVIREAGLGENFANAVHAIYNDIKTFVNINGNTDEQPVRPTRGIRQGCPLSVFLFILVLELFIKQVNDDKKITGLKVEYVDCFGQRVRFHHKGSIYVDDTSMVTDIKDVTNIEAAAKAYKEIAGSKANASKTMVIPLGPINADDPPTSKSLGTSFQVNGQKDTEKLLGKQIGPLITPEEQMTPAMKKAADDFNTWSKRCTIYQRGVIARASSVCKITYVGATTNVPKNMIDTYERAQKKFMQGGVPLMVNYPDIHRPKEDGGVALIDPHIDIQVTQLYTFTTMLKKGNENDIGFDFTKKDLSELSTNLHPFRQPNRRKKAKFRYILKWNKKPFEFSETTIRNMIRRIKPEGPLSWLENIICIWFKSGIFFRDGKYLISINGAEKDLISTPRREVYQELLQKKRKYITIPPPQKNQVHVYKRAASLLHPKELEQIYFLYHKRIHTRDQKKHIIGRQAANGEQAAIDPTCKMCRQEAESHSHVLDAKCIGIRRALEHAIQDTNDAALKHLLDDLPNKWSFKTNGVEEENEESYVMWFKIAAFRIAYEQERRKLNRPHSKHTRRRVMYDQIVARWKGRIKRGQKKIEERRRRVQEKARRRPQKKRNRQADREHEKRRQFLLREDERTKNDYQRQYLETDEERSVLNEVRYQDVLTPEEKQNQDQLTEKQRTSGIKSRHQIRLKEYAAEEIKRKENHKHKVEHGANWDEKINGPNWESLRLQERTIHWNKAMIRSHGPKWETKLLLIIPWLSNKHKVAYGCLRTLNRDTPEKLIPWKSLTKAQQNVLRLTTPY